MLPYTPDASQRAAGSHQGDGESHQDKRLDCRGRTREDGSVLRPERRTLQHYRRTRIRILCKRDTKTRGEGVLDRREASWNLSESRTIEYQSRNSGGRVA